MTTLVECQKGHPEEFMFKPFSHPHWAKDVGNYPVVKLEAPEGLTGLAKFLADNLTATHNHRSAIVTCYAAEGTERELLRKAHAGRMGSNGVPYAENIIKVYGISETERAVINDWGFEKLAIDQSPEDYWNNQAAIMLRAGVEVVKIRKSPGSVAVVFEAK